MKMIASEIPTPRSAVISGSPAATNDANVNTSTTNATTMPSSSVTLMPVGALREELTADRDLRSRRQRVLRASLPARCRASFVDGSTALCADRELDRAPAPPRRPG